MCVCVGGVSNLEAGGVDGQWSVCVFKTVLNQQ